MKNNNRKTIKSQNMCCFVNQSIKSYEEDLMGLKSHIDKINLAINKGASMIGIIGDFGSGKSSLTSLLKQHRTIHINMWDSLKLHSKDEKENSSLSTSEIDILKKSFLYQLAAGTGKKSLMKYVIKRLDGRSGFLSITVKGFAFWVYIVIALIFMAIGVALFSSDFTLKILSYTLNNNIRFFFYGLAAVVMLICLSKTSIVFSSWKSEGNKDATVDLQDVFFEIIDSIKTRKGKKTAIIIEDLDRIDKTELIKQFLREIYRYNTYSQEHNIVFLLALKPEAVLDKPQSENERNLYDKFFDYQLHLNPIASDDFSTLLLKLIRMHSQQIKELTGQDVENCSSLPKDFSWLCKGNQLNIRDLKHRLNTTLNLYSNLKNNNAKYGCEINLYLCSAVSYMKHNYGDIYYQAIINNDKIAETVKVRYDILNDNVALTDSDKRKKLIAKMQGKLQEDTQDKRFEILGEMADLILMRVIDDDYRKYFFDAPLGNYIIPAPEKQLKDTFWTVSDFQTIRGINLEDILSKIVDVQGVVLKHFQDFINQKGTLPKHIFYNKLLYEIAYAFYSEAVIELMGKELLIIEPYAETTFEILKNILSMNLDETTAIFDEYCRKIRASLAAQKISDICNERVKLVKRFKKDILLFKELFINESIILISNEELNEIDNIDTKWELINFNKLNLSSISGLRECVLNDPIPKRFINQFVDKIVSFCTPQYEKDRKHEFSVTCLAVLHVNGLTDLTLFKAAFENYRSIQEKMIFYINEYASDFSDDHLTIIGKSEIFAKLGQKILERLLAAGQLYVYLLNNLNNHTLDEVDFEQILLEENVSNFLKINKNFPELFVQLRRHILSQSAVSQKNKTLLFSDAFPLISIEEVDYLGYDHLTEVVNISTFTEKNCDIPAKIFRNKVLSGVQCVDFVKRATKYIWLSSAICNCLPDKINLLTTGQKEEIYCLYRKECRLPLSCGCVEFIMNKLEYMNCEMEKIFLNEINANSYTPFKAKYNEAINKYEICSENTVMYLKQNSITFGLCDKITNELKKHDFKKAVIGKILFYEHFEMESDIPLHQYINVLLSSKDKIYDKMIENEEFIDAIYNSDDFSILGDKVTIFTDRPYTVNLLDAILKQQSTIGSKKKILLGIKSLKNPECNEGFTEYMVKEENDELLSDPEIANKCKDLLSKGQKNTAACKGKLTKKHRSLNKQGVMK